jgi:hypothetical protein
LIFDAMSLTRDLLDEALFRRFDDIIEYTLPTAERKSFAAYYKYEVRRIVMPEPITTMTASAIATLAFQEFVKSGAGELAKKFTAEAIAKMGQLRELIWKRLAGNHSAADAAIEKARAGDSESTNTIAKLLDVEMLDNDFAGQVRAIAQEINAGKLLDQSSMTQNNYDNAKGWQTKVEGGTAYIGEIHISEKRSEN